MNKCRNNNCPKASTCKCRKVKHARIPIIWVLGGPGSGKSTQCKRIEKTLGLTHICTGELLRKQFDEQSEVSRQYENLLHGELVDDDNVIQLLEKTMLKQRKNCKGYIVDGTPRTLAQSELFETFIAPVDTAIYLDCDDVTMNSRISNRFDNAGPNVHPDDETDPALKKIEVFKLGINDIFIKYDAKINRIDANRTEDSIFDDIKPIIKKCIDLKLLNPDDDTCCG